MEKVFLTFNKNICIGCHSCEVACKQEHGLGVGPRLVRVIEKSPDFIPVYCHHCAKAPCKESCPVGAITRDEKGIVLIDKELCIGCRDCIEQCPFGVMQYDYHQELAIKCDLCIERLVNDKQPACMSVCPTGCIHFRKPKNIATMFER